MTAPEFIARGGTVERQTLGRECCRSRWVVDNLNGSGDAIGAVHGRVLVGSDDGQPLWVDYFSPMDDIKKSGLDGFSDRPAGTLTDDAVVEFSDRGHFSSCPGKEGLI